MIGPDVLFTNREPDVPPGSPRTDAVFPTRATNTFGYDFRKGQVGLSWLSSCAAR